MAAALHEAVAELDMNEGSVVVEAFGRLGTGVQVEVILGIAEMPERTGKKHQAQDGVVAHH